MQLADIIGAEGVVSRLRVSSKKQLIQELAKRAAGPSGIGERVIYDILMERERLGSTGLGHGIAIPHGRIANLKKLCGMFIRLDPPVDFEAIDERPVDLVFLLLAPEDAGADHLKALAKITRTLRDEAICAKLRGCDKEDALRAIIATGTGEE